jgi:hypothetical protein
MAALAAALAAILGARRLGEPASKKPYPEPEPTPWRDYMPAMEALLARARVVWFDIEYSFVSPDSSCPPYLVQECKDTESFIIFGKRRIPDGGVAGKRLSVKWADCIENENAVIYALGRIAYDLRDFTAQGKPQSERR